MDLLASFALCALSAIGYTLIRSHARRLGPRLEAALLGLVFGLGALLSMSAPLELKPGIIFDGRGAMIILSAGFGGPLAAVVCGLLVSLYRLHIGGAGAYIGASTPWLYVLLGLVIYFLRRRRLIGETWRIVGLSFSAAGVLPFVFLVIPTGIPWNLISDSVLFASPTGALMTLLLGLLLNLEDERRRTLDRNDQLIAELQQREHDLEEREQAATAGSAAKTRFLAAMSHEMRTPLNGILGMIALARQSSLPPEAADYLDTAEKSGEVLLGVINQVLDFSKIEAGKIEFDHRDFNIASLLQKTMAVFEPQAREKGVELRMRIPEDSPPILLGDPQRIQQVLFNLVGNAVKFTSRGFVDVDLQTTTRDADKVALRISVRDTGIGIPEADKDRVFGEFEQVGKGRGRFGGTGLGLAISRQIVLGLGGTIGFTSAEGVGSHFWFEVTLPQGTGEHLRRRAPVTATLRPLSILVAEDAAANRKLIQEVLTRLGHRVELAFDGQQALALARAKPYDAILMDVQMPIMDGVEATRAIRRLPPPAGEVPIIAVTANAFLEQRREYLEAGMNDCIIKPIDFQDLMMLLARLTDTLPPQTPTPRAADAGEGPLDLATLASLEGVIGRQELMALLGSALSEISDGLSRLRDQTLPEEEVSRIAHTLKGVAGNLGFTELAAACGELQRKGMSASVREGLIETAQAAFARTESAATSLPRRLAPT